MRTILTATLLSLLSLLACTTDEPTSSDISNNGTGNNGQNNGDANNGAVNNTNNGDTNNGGSNNGANNVANNGDVVRETVFPIGYVLRNRAEIPDVEQGGDYFVMASDGSQMVKVNPEEISCHLGCELTDDLAWFIWNESSGLDSQLKIAPVTGLDYSGVTLDMASAKVIESNALRYEVGGGMIAFMSSDFEVVAGPLPGDNAVTYAVVGGAESTQGGFYLKPDGTELITWTVTLQSMTLNQHSIGTGDERLEFYTFESTGFGGTGSFYTSSERMSWSPDGQYLATVSTALVDTNRCTSDNDCSGADEVCGNNARCTSQRLTVNMVNMAETQKLGGACTSDGDCGQAHFCDFSDPADPNSGRCLPGRLDLGPAGPQACATLTAGQFTEVRSELAWSPDSQQLYLLAAEDCENYNIPRTAILYTTPALDDPTILFENPGTDFSVGNCYDEDEQEFVAEADACVIEVEQMVLAPSGQTIAFSGTAPAAQNASRHELFTIDRKGERNKKWFQQSDIFKTVEQLQALPDL